MNIFASFAQLVLLATLAFPLISQAQNQPAARAGASDFNQSKKRLIDQQTRIVNLMEGFKRCYSSPPKDVASKTRCDADAREFFKHLDDQVSLSRIQIKCANAATSVQTMQECLAKEIRARQASATAQGQRPQPIAPAQGAQPVKR